MGSRRHPPLHAHAQLPCGAVPLTASQRTAWRVAPAVQPHRRLRRHQAAPCVPALPLSRLTGCDGSSSASEHPTLLQHRLRSLLRHVCQTAMLLRSTARPPTRCPTCTPSHTHIVGRALQPPPPLCRRCVRLEAAGGGRRGGPACVQPTRAGRRIAEQSAVSTAVRRYPLRAEPPRSHAPADALVGNPPRGHALSTAPLQLTSPPRHPQTVRTLSCSRPHPLAAPVGGAATGRA